MNSLIIPASYTDTGVARFAGNPFVEAMPPLESTKAAFLTSLSHYPVKPTGAVKKAGEIVRIMELSSLNDLVFPFPEYQKAALALTTIMREAYVARNPLSVVDRQRRHVLATQDASGLPLPSNWKSSAKGHSIMAVSGMGKTTFVKAFLLRYPQVIAHRGYRGEHLNCHQVVYVLIRIPHDATLKGLCLQFFREIDGLLGTQYAAQAIRVWTIASMVDLMNKVATAVSLGLLVVDEVQNLKNAKGGDADVVLNLFSEIIERLGISLVTIATPAVQEVFEGSVRNARKIASHGETVIKPMGKKDAQWRDFCETHWAYTYVKKHGPLTQPILDTWHKVSAGNTAFAALAFSLAQRNEIGGREIIDEAAFERTAAVDMGFLQPAIAALRSGKPAQMRAFDDLMFSEQYRALRASLGASESAAAPTYQEEFEEINGRKESKPSKSARVKTAPQIDPFDQFGPAEDPLARV